MQAASVDAAEVRETWKLFPDRRKVEGMEIWWMNESSKAASRESNLKIEFKLCGKAAERERREKALPSKLI